MSTKRKAPACGNPDCGVSTGMYGMLTFGSGELDFYGFWQHPCRVCAAAFDAGRDARLTGLEREYRERFPNDPERVDEMMKDANWAREPAWPFADEMVPCDRSNPMSMSTNSDTSGQARETGQRQE